MFCGPGLHTSTIIQSVDAYFHIFSIFIVARQLVGRMCRLYRRNGGFLLGLHHHSLFLTLAAAIIPEPFGEGVIIDFQLRNLFILISSDGDKFGLFEDISAKSAVRKLHDIVCLNEMKTWLILVHGIQYRGVNLIVDGNWMEKSVFVRNVVGQF